MPLLLLLPLLVVAVVLLWLLLLPLAMWQRYRSGRQRRRAVAWAIGINAWSLLVSAMVLLFSAWTSSFWVEGALRFAAGGLAIGVLLGWPGLALTRFETTPQGLFYTPNRWVALALTAMVVAKLAYGIYRLQQAWIAGQQSEWLSQQGGVWAVGGVLIGYYLAYAWGLRARLRRG